MAAVSLAVFLLLSTAHAKSAVQTRTAEQRASMWLRNNADPDQAGMDDLKGSDPTAFAIVQALLTKKSLGLLDPTNPSASFTGTKKVAQRSFAEEAAAAGVTATTAITRSDDDAQSASVALPYPTAGAAMPFPDVASGHHDHFNFQANNDDAMVQSVLGAASELKAQPQAAARSSSNSLLSSASGVNTPIALDWGNTYAGTSSRGQPMPSAPMAMVASRTQSTDQSSDQSSMAMSSAMTADADALGVEQAVQEENAHNPGVASVDHHAPIAPPSITWANPHAIEDDASAKSQMAMGQQNAYLAATPLTTRSQDRNQDYASNLESNSFHKLAQSFRKFESAATHPSMSQSNAQVAQVASPLARDFGPGYNKALQAAKNDQWKFALESTSWGKNSAPVASMTQVEEDLDDDPDAEKVRQQKLAKFLGAPYTHKHYEAPAKTMMTQESEDSDGGARFAQWIGSSKATDLEKSYDNALPKNEYMKSYMADLTH